MDSEQLVEVVAIERGHDGTSVREVGEKFSVSPGRLKDGSTWFVSVEKPQEDRPSKAGK